ncbi:MAG: endonuclease/exonuclease/phosphatase family protein [Candidatus Microsaccharimonas sp.]
MKIVFLNVWGNEMQDSLIPFLREQAHDTPVFCLQEATSEMKQRSADVFSNYVEIAHHKYINDHDIFCQSLFVRKDIEILDSGVLAPDDMDRGLANFVKIKLNGQEVSICNVHGRARPAEKLDNPERIAFSQSLVDFFKDATGPVIIGGDFNILPDTESIQLFARNGYQDLISEYAIDTTRNHLAWDRYPTKLYYSDYLFVSQGLTVNHFSVPKNEISDHLPMLLEVAL